MGYANIHVENNRTVAIHSGSTLVIRLLSFQRIVQTIHWGGNRESIKYV